MYYELRIDMIDTLVSYTFIKRETSQLSPQWAYVLVSFDLCFEFKTQDVSVRVFVLDVCLWNW